MPKISEKQLRNLCREDPARVVDALLDSEFWLHTISTGQTYGRNHDDTDGEAGQFISILFDQMGDAYMDKASNYPWPLRFRTYEGGGHSLKTRKALLILAEAIRQDNEERPIADPFKQS
jgi:hypothetical protein